MKETPLFDEESVGCPNQRSLDTEPETSADLAEAYYNRGAAKAELKITDEARKDFEITLELARNANNAKIMAQAEQALRDLDEADG